MLITARQAGAQSGSADVRLAAAIGEPRRKVFLVPFWRVDGRAGLAHGGCVIARLSGVLSGVGRWTRAKRSTSDDCALRTKFHRAGHEPLVEARTRDQLTSEQRTGAPHTSQTT